MSPVTFRFRPLAILVLITAIGLALPSSALDPKYSDFSHGDWSQLTDTCQSRRVLERIEELRPEAAAAGERTYALTQALRLKGDEIALIDGAAGVEAKREKLLDEYLQLAELAAAWSARRDYLRAMLNYYYGLQSCAIWDEHGARVTPKAPPPWPAPPPARPGFQQPPPGSPRPFIWTCLTPQAKAELEALKAKREVQISLLATMRTGRADLLAAKRRSQRLARPTTLIDKTLAETAHKIAVTKAEIDKLTWDMSWYMLLPECKTACPPTAAAQPQLQPQPPAKSDTKGDPLRPATKGGATGERDRGVMKGGVLKGVGVVPCPPPGQPGSEEEEDGGD